MFTTVSVYQELPGQDAIEANLQKALEIMNGEGPVPATVITYDENQNSIATKQGWPTRVHAEAWLAWIASQYTPISSQIIEE
jgi:hypothetical protein